MRSEVTVETESSLSNRWIEFLTRWKEPTMVVGAIIVILTAFGGGVIAGAAWFVDPKVEALRGELKHTMDTTNAEMATLRERMGTSEERTQDATTTLYDNLGANSGRISGNGERIAGMEAKLTGTSDRVDRLYRQVTKNSDDISVVGIGHGERWMRSVRRPDEWFDLLERSAADRVKRTLEGESELAERTDVLLPDRQSAALATAARRDVKGAVDTLPLEFVDETLAFHPEWVVDRVAPRPVLFITAADDRLVPPEESRALYEKAGEPRKLVVLEGYGHYEVSCSRRGS